MLTQSQLKEILHYNPETGIFTWINPCSRKIKDGDRAGTINKKGYVMIFHKMKCYIAHRLAWLYMTGEYPDHIDHIDGKKDNNKIKNLRNVSSLENSRNKRPNSRNKSGFNGVSCLRNGKFRASIGNNLKCIHLGDFERIDDAINARKEADLKYSYHENHGLIIL